jgi:hypothetical protein
MKFKWLATMTLLPFCILANTSNHKFSAEVGAGTSYTLYGVNISYAYKNVGVGLLVSPYRFLNNYAGSVYRDFGLGSGSVVIGPAASFGHRSGPHPFNAYYVGSSVNVKGYISRGLYIKHQWGLEYDWNESGTKHFFPHFGVGLGYTFGGGNNCEAWGAKNFIFNGVGFGSGTLFTIGFSYLFLLLLYWD